MDELELRIQGHEMAFIEVVAHIDREHMVAAISAVRAGLVDGVCQDERAIRVQAMGLLDDAMRRYEPPAIGMHWPA